MKKVILILIILMFIMPNLVFATDETISQEDIMESQQESLDINSFIEEADKYTGDVYADIDMGELFSSAITGKIDNKTILKSILNAMRRRGIRQHNSISKYISYNSYT